MTLCIADKYSSLSTDKLASKGKSEDYLSSIELNIDADTFYKMIGNIYFTAMAVLYLFSQSSFKGKNIELSSFDNLEISSSDYAIGFLNGFETTGLIDFKIHENVIIPSRYHTII